MREKDKVKIIDKPTFGSVELGEYIKQLNDGKEKVEELTLIGLCTDICVISNALLLKAFLPESANPGGYLVLRGSYARKP